jgi:anti-anti-sigma factor
LLEVLGRPDVTDVELDLTGVTYLGAAGLKTLVIAHQAAERTGRRLTIRCGTSRAVLRSLHITGLSTVFSIVDL